MTRVVLVGVLLCASIVAGCASEPESTRDLVTTTEFVEGQAPVDGGTVYYSRVGAGCPVVLIGGGSAMGVRQWAETASWLEATHTVVRFDPRGVGRSPVPRTPYADSVDLAVLLDSLGLERVVVVGNSSSAGLALEFAVTYPERVSGIVAVAPFIPGYPMSDSMLERVGRLGATVSEGADAFIAAILADPHFLPAPDHPEARELGRRLITDNFDKMANSDVDLPISLDPPLVEQLDRVLAPLLLLVGELDHPDLHERVVFVEQAAPRARTVTIDRAGHTLHLEQPLLFGRELQRFLDDVDCR